ncbi:MAG: isopentenyl phosphate kinase [Candidatus Asgardarchaeia archaeon]
MANEYKEQVVLKIGGSVVSDKTKEELSIKSNLIDEISREIKNLIDKGYRFYLVHGVGNAGHPPVKKYKLHLGFRDKSQLIGYANAQNRVNKLRQEILEALERHGVPAIEFYPSSMIISDKMKVIKFYSDPMKMITSTGITPVASGDMVADTSMGLSVCSGDILVFEFAKVFDVKTILFGIDVNGIYSGDPKLGNAELIEEIKIADLPELLKEAGGSLGIDVSGGMKGKIKTMLAYKEFFESGGKVILFNLTNPENLFKVLEDPEKVPHTTISA